MERGCGGRGGYYPYFDPDYECLTEKINPPSVCVDNETCADCTLVKVDSANKHGILLEMVQVLTDLDLVISKSYISSDGGWFMDVFHVTDQFGRKLSDRSLISYIQQSLFSRRLRSGLQPVKTCLGRVVDPKEATAASPSEGYTALELTVTDGPGLLSELCAVVSAFDCVVVSAQAWTRHCRGACIMYVADRPIGGPVSEGNRLTELENKLEQVMAAHHGSGQRWRLGLRNVVPAESQVQTERRLHQLMHDDGDGDNLEDEDGTGKNRVAKLKMGTVVSIDSCLEKGYSVVSIRSRDRPKLLFDTVCTLTDMNYVVSHATITSHGAIASQEYFIRRMDGLPLKSEAEKRRVARCLVAAIERRVSHGLKFNVCTPNGLGLLCDVTRAFREHGLSVTGAEVGTRDDQAVGTFYVTDASGEEVNLGSVNKVREQVGRTMAVEVDASPAWPMVKRRSEPAAATPEQNEERARLSLGSVFWSRLVRLSHFGSIRS